ncbi:hypothetical protein JRC04_05295 [Mycolicibacterium sp. S2-37]|uniref:hypothetical protein n=1 Tax=Mycolicibacterium sp. S2-37 TaxID=2810297 RepID=UPI001A93CFCC|nr:hypothetical protein [Mycolicibacterium sp. S2-37]MBO0676870.1 hypothetical protein [Mycolicibacterium sp. S2-37]
MSLNTELENVRAGIDRLQQRERELVTQIEEDSYPVGTIIEARGSNCGPRFLIKLEGVCDDLGTSYDENFEVLFPRSQEAVWLDLFSDMSGQHYPTLKKAQANAYGKYDNPQVIYQP